MIPDPAMLVRWANQKAAMTIETGSRRHPDLSDLPPIHRLEVVTLQAGDLLVATVEGPISAQQAANMEARLKAKVPDGVTVVIVSGQIDLAAYRPAPTDG
jgi:hypothetical protein